MVDAPQVRYVEPTVCQTARTVTSSASAWTLNPWLEFMGGDEGAGQVVGSAAFRLISGRRTAINQPTMQTVVAANLRGQLVRVLVRDDAGDVELDGDTWAVLWMGRLVGRARSPQGKSDATNGSYDEYQAVGIGASLDQLYVNRGYALAADGTTVADPGRCPRFNHLAYGDRSASTVNINGASVYVHRLDSEASHRWTARNVVDLLLGVFARPPNNVNGIATGWPWEVSDADGCLDYDVQDLNLDGLTIFQALVLLCGQRRGLSFTFVPSAIGVTMVVTSGSATAISVGDFTLPAATTTTAFDVRDENFYDQPRVIEDESSVHDIIEIRGANPLMAITIDTEQTEEGWTGVQQTDWENAPTASLTESVHRRYYLAATWDGASASNPEVGLRWLRPVEDSEAYGESGQSGEREFQASTAQVTALALSADRMLPCDEVFGATVTGPRAAPVIVAQLSDTGYDGGGWVDAATDLKWSIQIESQPVAFRIDDRADGEDLKEYVANGRVAVTLGIRERHPLLVSWRRPQGEWPTAIPRTKTVDMPQCEQWIVLDGTVTGVDEDGNLVKVDGDVVVRDDVPTMRQYLALYRAYFTTPAIACEITNRAILDFSATTRPGVLVTSLTAGDGTITVNSVITRRRFVRVVVDGVPMFHTVYSTERVTPDLDAVL